jgi:hypothetical protein
MQLAFTRSSLNSVASFPSAQNKPVINSDSLALSHSELGKRRSLEDESGRSAAKRHRTASKDPPALSMLLNYSSSDSEGSDHDSDVELHPVLVRIDRAHCTVGNRCYERPFKEDNSFTLRPNAENKLED